MNTDPSCMVDSNISISLDGKIWIDCGGFVAHVSQTKSKVTKITIEFMDRDYHGKWKKRLFDLIKQTKGFFCISISFNGNEHEDKFIGKIIQEEPVDMNDLYLQMEYTISRIEELT